MFQKINYTGAATRMSSLSLFYKSEIGEGPLEKLRGGGREFSSRSNFFRYQIPCMNFF